MMITRVQESAEQLVLRVKVAQYVRLCDWRHYLIGLRISPCLVSNDHP